jgi:hypothetical protein
VNIRLIDAYCIDPKHPLFLSVSQGLQSLKEIRAYEKCLSVYPDLSTGRLVSPCVRKRLILWLLSKCDMRDATYNMTDIHFRRLEDYQPNAVDVGIERSTSIGKVGGVFPLLTIEPAFACRHIRPTTVRTRTYLGDGPLGVSYPLFKPHTREEVKL